MIPFKLISYDSPYIRLLRSKGNSSSHTSYSKFAYGKPNESNFLQVRILGLLCLRTFCIRNNNLLFTLVESGPREHAEPCLALVIPRYCRRRRCFETDPLSQWDGEDILSRSDMTSARSAINPSPRRYEQCQILWSIPIARNMVRPRRKPTSKTITVHRHSFRLSGGVKHKFNISTVLVRFLNMKFHSDTFHCAFNVVVFVSSVF